MNAIPKSIILLAVLIFFSNCTSKNNKLTNSSIVQHYGHEDFPFTETLSKKEILQNDSFHHHKLYILDTILLTTSNSGTYHFHAYHSTNLNYLGSFGVRGEGPEAWIMPHTTEGQHEITDSGISLWLFDFMKGHLSKTNLTKTLKSSSQHPIVTKKYNVDGRKFPFFRLFYINDEKLISDCWITEQNRVRIKSYNPKLEVKQSESTLFPKMLNINKLPAEVVNSLYTTSFKKHPSKNLFVQAMATFNRIDIFDENLTLKNSMVDGENWQDNYYDATEIDLASDFLSDKIDGYNGTSVTNNFIFALEMGKPNNDQIAIQPESFVRVYDWDGRPVCLLHFINKINAIAVDEQTGFLFATDYENELVLRYDIKKLFKEWKN